MGTLPPEASSVAGTAVPWLALAWRLPALRRRPRDARLLTWCLAVLFLALALTVFSPPVYLAVGRLTGLPNLDQLLGNEATVVSATAILVLLTHVETLRLPPVRRVAALSLVGAGFLVLLAVLFLRVPSRPAQPDYWGHYASLPGVAAYRLAYLLYLGWTALNLTRLGVVYASVSTRPSTRLGVHLVALGGVAGCLDVLDEAARVLGLGALTGSRTLSTVTFVLLLVGATVPGWGPRVGVDAGLRWLDEYRSLRRLYPLWLVLCRGRPAVALTPPGSALVDAVDVRDVHFRLYRRVVEIGDALLLLAADPASSRLATLAARYRSESAAGGAPAAVGRGTFQGEVRALERLARDYRD